MIKILLIVLIVVGGFTLMMHYTPTLVSQALFNVAGFTVTGGLVAVFGLLMLGIKFVSNKH